MKKPNRIQINQSQLIVIIILLITLLPMIFVITNSFMSQKEIINRYTRDVTPYNYYDKRSSTGHFMAMTFIPEVISVDAYKEVLLDNPEYLRMIWNSLILTIPIIIGQLLISPLAAFGFEQMNWKHKEKLFFAYMMVMIMPLQVVLVPHFIAARALHIDKSYLAIILPTLFTPFGTFLIRQQMRGFNRSIIEAARVDGASELQVFYKFVLPNLKPSMIALLILTFAECWNIVDQAVVFITKVYDQPLSVFLSGMSIQEAGVTFALAAIFILPSIIVFIYGQDYLAEGIVLSGAK